MKFQRDELRHESLTVTGRKVQGFSRKQAREADALPLFSEQNRAEQHSWDDELQRRERANHAFVVGQRRLMARF